MSQRTQAEAPVLYRYSFGTVAFDEARFELQVGDQIVELEQRPLQVLACLLHNADEVVTRQELFDAVWLGRPTVDNVLANAVTKLRKALGSDEAGRIITVPRVGYRLTGPVTRTASGRRLVSQLDLVTGQPVPGREHMLLRKQLGPSRGSEVWLARHAKTGKLRVYKFSTDGERLAILKREATIYRVLHDSLGERDDFVRVIDWNFETTPFWLECEYGGPDLLQWAEGGSGQHDPEQHDFAHASSDGKNGLAGLDEAARVGLFLQIADAIAAAHSVGVLHKDIKPANVLIGDGRDGGWQIRIADFGNSRLLEPGRLESLGITAMGMTVTQGSSDSSGTPMYLAPELQAGQSPTVQSDVYALGLVLYQLLVGDLRQPIAPGWEDNIADELLREDVAAATNGSPQQRLRSVDELCQRLRGRDARRVERTQLRETQAQAQQAKRMPARNRARRPWIAAVMALLVVGLAVGAWQFERTRQARDEAQHQAAIANATNQFLNEDLLGGGIGGVSPAWYEKNPTLTEILDAAAPRLSERFDETPEVAAGLHQTMARAYKTLGSYKKAVEQMQLATTLLNQTLGPLHTSSLLAEYELVGLLAHLSQFDKAEKRLAQTDARAGDERLLLSELGLRSHLTQARLAYQQLQFERALTHYQAAEIQRMTLRPDDAPMAAMIARSMAGAHLRLDQAELAEPLIDDVLSAPWFNEQRIGKRLMAQTWLTSSRVLSGQGKQRQAIKAASLAVKSLTEVIGADGQSTISALSFLGYLYYLAGDSAKSLAVQKDVYQRSLQRWGLDNQYTLIELLNLAASEQEAGDLEAALAHLDTAVEGLIKVSGADSPTVHAGRSMQANVLRQLGRYEQALDLINRIDPEIFQASSTLPGRAAFLAGQRAMILVDMGRADGMDALRQAVAAMQAGGVPEAEIAMFRERLDG